MKKILVLAAALCLALCVFGAGCVDNDEPSGGGGASSGEELDVKVGDSFTIGTYNGKALEWDVLAVDTKNEKVLLFLDGHVGEWVFENGDSPSWQTSSIRAKLNGDFFNEVFTDEEKADILQTTVKNPANSRFSTSGGADTIDRLFLLSESEADTYFTEDEDRRLPGSEQWYLRTPGEYSDYFMLITDSGSLYYTGADSENSYFIRPAFWLDLSADEEE